MDQQTTRHHVALFRHRKIGWLRGVSYETAATWWLLVGAIPFLGLNRPVHDPDLFWQLAAGRWQWLHHRVIRLDPFSFTASDRVWLDHSWLWQVLVWPLYQKWGGAGLLLMSSLVFLITTICLVAACRRWAPELTAWLPPAIAGVMVIVPYANPRPQQLGLCLFSVLTLLFSAPRFTLKPKTGFVLFFYFLIWANLHASAMLGLAFVLVTAVEQWFLPRSKDDPPDRARRGALTALALAAAGSLCTPWGMRLWGYPFSAAIHPFSSHYINEFLPPGVGMTWALRIVVALMVTAQALPFVTRRYPKWSVWGLGLALAVMALKNRVYIPFYAVLVGPVCAMQLQTVLEGFQVKRYPAPHQAPASRSESDPGAPVLERSRLALLSLVLLAPTLLTRLPEIHLEENIVNPASYPSGATAWMNAHGYRGKLFNHYDWGGFLLFDGPESLKVFVDGRAETLYSEQTLDLCRRAQQGDPTAPRLMAAVADWAIYPSDHLMSRRLAASPLWRIAYQDSTAWLFHRVDESRRHGAAPDKSLKASTAASLEGKGGPL